MNRKRGERGHGSHLHRGLQTHGRAPGGYSLAEINDHRSPSRGEMHKQNAKAQTGADQADFRERLHPVVVRKDIIQRIRAEPVLACKIGKSAKACSKERFGLPLTEGRLPNGRAVAFLTRLQNAVLGEIAGLIGLPSRAQSD